MVEPRLCGSPHSIRSAFVTVCEMFNNYWMYCQEITGTHALLRIIYNYFGDHKVNFVFV